MNPNLSIFFLINPLSVNKGSYKRLSKCELDEQKLFFIYKLGHCEEDKRVKRAYDGLLLDAGGTLLQLSEPVHETYASLGQKYGRFLYKTSYIFFFHCLG